MQSINQPSSFFMIIKSIIDFMVGELKKDSFESHR